MKKILIISKNSTLSKIFRKKSNLKNYDVFSHNELNQINFSNYSYLINFSFNPKLAQLKYNKKYDIDNFLAQGMSIQIRIFCPIKRQHIDFIHLIIMERIN